MGEAFGDGELEAIVVDAQVPQEAGKGDPHPHEAHKTFTDQRQNRAFVQS